jgi:hypothetical protein
MGEVYMPSGTELGFIDGIGLEWVTGVGEVEGEEERDGVWEVEDDGSGGDVYVEERDGVEEDEDDGSGGDEYVKERNGVGEDEGVEVGDGVGEYGGVEDDGLVLTEVCCTFRMYGADEDVDCPIDEGVRGVVTRLSSKMSFCAPLPKLYKSRYSGGE